MLKLEKPLEDMPASVAAPAVPGLNEQTRSKSLVDVALQTAVIYGVIAAIWILVSDKLLVALVSDPVIIGRIAIAKGCTFVVVTSFLLYAILRRQLRRWEREVDARRISDRDRRKWADAFEHCAHGIALHEAGSTRILACNPAFARLHGRTVEETTCSSATDLFHPSAHPYILHSLDVADRTGQVRFEALRVRADGSVFPAQVDIVSVSDAAGRPLYRVATVEDITEQKVHRREIERLNHLYATLSAINGAIVRATSPAELFQEICRVTVEHGGFKLVWVGLCDPETHAVRVVSRAGKDTGYLDEIRVYCDDRPEAQGIVGTCIREGCPSISNDIVSDPRMAPWRSAAVMHGWLSAAAFPIRVEGRVCGAFTVYSEEPDAFQDSEVALLTEAARDISFGLEHLRKEERRLQAEGALADEVTRRRVLFEQSPDGIVVIDPDTDRIVEFNRTAHEQLGYSREEFVALRLSDIVADRNAEQIHAVTEKVTREGRIDFEGLHRTKQGDLRIVRVTVQATRILGRPFHHSVWRDVTERRRAEAQVRKLSRAVEQSPVSIIITTSEGKIEYVNPKFTQLTGYTLEEVRGQNPRILKSGETPADEYRRLWSTITRGGEWRGELHNKKKNGELFWEFASISAIVDEAGRIAGFLAVKEDITDRKQAEDTLRRQASLFDQTYDAVLAWDWEGPLTFWNRGAEELYAFSRDQALGKSPRALLQTKTLDGSGDFLSALQRDSRWEGELEQVTRDGRHVRLESRMVLVREAGRAYVLEVNRDITSRQLLEEQLRQAQKMEAIGRLAGGVAHDFNNLLGVILGYSSLMLDTIEDPTLRRKLDEIHKAGQRAAGLTRQLLAFSRKQILEPRVLNPNSLIRDVEKMLRRLIGEDIQLEAVLDSGLGQVHADPGQMEQVIMNLAVNARDAMPRGGKLTIETHNLELDDLYARQHVSVRPGPYVQIVVSDTGTGMDPATQAHIFEPFFTTKKEGTGLGLATVYGIIKQSGGNIWVYSEPGKGTTFKIYLPRVDQPADKARNGAPAALFPAGTETILIVEDAEPVRDIAKEFLELSGYTILSAAGPSEALDLVAQHHAPIHLLLTDVIMPGMSGPQLAGKLQSLREGMKVLFMSGYTDTAIAHHGVLDPGKLLIMKPFSRETLTQKVREALGTP
jgi:two-component system, cell cycle sensor histidine kinase and response regulator CckA